MEEVKPECFVQNPSCPWQGREWSLFMVICFTLEERPLYSFLFSYKGSPREGRDGTPIKDGEHLLFCRTGRGKKSIYNRTTLILHSLEKEDSDFKQNNQHYWPIIARVGKQPEAPPASQAPLACTRRIYPVPS